MSKRELKKYVSELNKEQLEIQILDLYEKFSAVKVYYDFVFNPKEEQLLRESKLKISNEYFPIKKTSKRTKPKLRRSVAQKIIKHFLLLGVDSHLIADLMFYSIEIAQAYTAENGIKQELFYKSMSHSFDQAVKFCISMGILAEFKTRILKIHTETQIQKWKNSIDFQLVIESIEN